MVEHCSRIGLQTIHSTALNQPYPFFSLRLFSQNNSEEFELNYADFNRMTYFSDREVTERIFLNFLEVPG